MSTTVTSPDEPRDPLAVAELFARDPLELTTADIDEIIAIMRDKRKQFKLAESGGGRKRTAAKKTPKKTKLEQEVAALKIDTSGITL